MHFQKGSHKRDELFKGKHRYEHWYRDNTLYFITSRCRDGTPAFASEGAKAIFWDRFEHYARERDFRPWIVTLLDNHYHVIGYLEHESNLSPMMQRFHGSVAKLVNDRLDQRLVPFWSDGGHQNYFDGCLRDEMQYLRAYRYTLLQAVRSGICREWQEYAHTRVYVGMEEGLLEAKRLGVFLRGVPYKRYQRRGRKSGGGLSRHPAPDLARGTTVPGWRVQRPGYQSGTGHSCASPSGAGWWL